MQLCYNENTTKKGMVSLMDIESLNFEHVKSQDLPLPERVAAQISKLIVDRQLTSEDKLPNEFELAAMLNVGRGTIREAVKLLVARNILVIKRGKGTYIAHHPGQIDDPLGFAYYEDQFQLAKDLLEVRLQMEPWVASLAAKKATDEDIENVWATCHLVENDILSGVDHLPNDTKYHISIAKCTHNLVVPKLIPIITYSVGLFGSLNGNSLLAETISGHRTIAEAIASRNAERASQAMYNHIARNREELNSIGEHMENPD